MTKLKLSELLDRWHALAEIPVNENEETVVPFMDFAAEIPRATIFEWFEEQHACFSAGNAMQGNFATIFDKKFRVSIEIETDLRNALQELEANGVDASEVGGSYLEEVSREEIGYALDEAKIKLLKGFTEGNDAREYGECRYSFEVEEVQTTTPISPEHLQDAINEHLESAVALVLKHMDDYGLKEEDNQGLAIVNRIQDVMKAVNGIEAAHIKTDKTVPVIISVTAREGAELDEDDETIPGRYLIRVPGNIPEEHLAAAALDAFHDKIPIGVLDDFDIVTTDGRSGEEIFDHASTGGYEWSHLNLDVDWLDAAPEDDPLMGSAGTSSPAMR
ncbi:hypothetical protein [Marinobacterium sp. BA1]|uniref:hypothetical protein n=1 Tax=Marinobacterium sp. BA1 TaxID=3138931 RepID=UPI0032E6FF86